MSTEEMVLLPEAAFVHQCHEKYKVTGVLHQKMDLFFHEYGIEGRIERRKHLLSFLEYNRIKQPSDQDCLKLSNKSLKEEMDEYLEDSFVVMYMREKAVSQ